MTKECYAAIDAIGSPRPLGERDRNHPSTCLCRSQSTNFDIVPMFQHKTLSSGLEALDFLALNHNKLTALAASHFDGLPSLSSLELDYNRIAKIDKAAFNGLESEREKHERNSIIDISDAGKLQQLSITHNKLNFFPSPALRPLFQLQVTDPWSKATFFQRGWNKDIFICDFAQKLKPNIQTLHLDSNAITTIESNAFQV